MFQESLIAPSVLSADFMNVGQDIRMLEESGADWVHVDVMDGHFVPNLTMGVPYLKQLRQITNLPIDAHLMISNPLRQIPWFIEAGADVITFHIEAVNKDEAVEAIRMIHAAGVHAAIAVKPSTDISLLNPFIADLEMVLVMSVEPGFSGQRFMENSIGRVSEVVGMAKAAGVSPRIQVDGGIGPDTIDSVSAAGADVFVCGNAFFKADDPVYACTVMRNTAEEARKAALGA